MAKGYIGMSLAWRRAQRARVEQGEESGEVEAGSAKIRLLSNSVMAPWLGWIPARRDRGIRATVNSSCLILSYAWKLFKFRSIRS